MKLVLGTNSAAVASYIVGSCLPKMYCFFSKKPLHHCGGSCFSHQYHAELILTIFLGEHLGPYPWIFWTPLPPKEGESGAACHSGKFSQS